MRLFYECGDLCTASPTAARRNDRIRKRISAARWRGERLIGGAAMADIIDFSKYAQEPELDDMSREELLDYLKAVRARIDQLDEREPEDMASEEYEAWGDQHEELEDLADEILDLLDEMGGPNG